jgi:membrane-associated protease RseP (regulator of RpoE activity)
MNAKRVMSTLIGTFLAVSIVASAPVPPALAGGRTASAAKDAWHGLGLNIDGRKEQDEITGELYYVFYDSPEVWSIERGSPAHGAGLQRGDRLVSIDGFPFTSPEAGRLFPSLEPGDRVTVTYERDGVEKETSWTVGSREREHAADRSPEDDEHLWYAGSHWGADFEVRGAEEAMVMVNQDRQEVLIIGDSMTVRVRLEGKDR